jgi:hypothetical protein
MSHIYEIRAFNTKEGKQNCFSVRGFKTVEEAKKAFLCRVRNVGMQRTKLIENGLPISFLADEIQLVAYNEAMTWLEEIKTWRAS